MKVQLVKAKSPKRWYAKQNGDLIGKTFKVAFSEEKSLKLERNVFEILSGKYKGKILDVKDTRIVVKLKTGP
ncbi:MAG: hypothetical protein Roseis2KO_24540 [Roseivirga sp.]